MFKEHPNIKRVVGDSFGGSVALELQKNHPELLTRVYGTLVLCLARGQQTPKDTVTQGTLISIFDRSAKTTPFTRDLLKAPAMAHQYANNAKNFKPDYLYIDMHKGIFTPNSRHETKFNPKDFMAKEPEKEKHDTSSNMR